MVIGTPMPAIPPTQNTAPVLEFNCLYTHDIRRKQKRWQDGFLRFHTFNKRVMVYDVPRNLIGGAHWNNEQLQDGDEVTLEKCGVLVQVAELVGRTETDLTEIFKSKKRSPNVAATSTSTRPTNHSVALRLPDFPARPLSTHNVPSKHRSLNALLGAPKGQLGKALIPATSPFEERRNGLAETSRPAKRPRVNTSHHFDPAVKDASIFKQQSLQQETKEVIDLCSQSPAGGRVLAGVSDDLSSSPQLARPHQLNTTATSVYIRSSSPAFQRQTTPKKRRIVSREATSDAQSARHLDLSEQLFSTPLQHKVKHKNVKQPWPVPCNIADGHQNDPQPQAPAAGVLPLGTRAIARRTESRIREPTSPNTNPVHDGCLATDRWPLDNATRLSGRTARKTLRIAVGVPKRKVLLCQNQLSSTTGDAQSVTEAPTLPVSGGAAVQPRSKTSQRQRLHWDLKQVDKKIILQSEQPLMPDYPLNVSPSNLGGPDLFSQATESNHARPRRVEIPADEPSSPKSAYSHQTDRKLRRIVSCSGDYKGGKLQAFSPSALQSQIALGVHSRTILAEDVPGDDPFADSLVASRPTRKTAKRVMNRAVSLDLASGGTPTVMLNRPFEIPKPPKPDIAVPDAVANPWSREAFDLFTWRPPGWNEQAWCRSSTTSVAVE